MAELYAKRQLNTIVAHLEEVHHAVGDVARRVKRAAEARLSLHRETGNAQITLTEGERGVDWFVNLEDPAAASIEYGHFVKGKYEDKEKPKYVPGLYILSTAAGLDAEPKQGPRRR